MKHAVPNTATLSASVRNETKTEHEYQSVDFIFREGIFLLFQNW